ncbi:hypothetical protein ACWGH2_14710 [Streptomyces sp. NPDC054871]
MRRCGRSGRRRSSSSTAPCCRSTASPPTPQGGSTATTRRAGHGHPQGGRLLRRLRCSINRITELLRFTSTYSGTQDADVSLSDYVARMKEGQDKIYYLLAPNPAAAAAGPHLEAFRTKGIEVLLLGEEMDGFVVSGPLRECQGKRLQSVAQGPPGFGDLTDDAEKQAADRASSDYAALLGRLKAHLAGKAWDVRVTSRLTTSPACIVTDGTETDVTAVQRLRGSGLPHQPILEINPATPWSSGSTADRTTRACPSGRMSCSTRRPLPRAPGSKSQPHSSPGSTTC